MGKYSGALKHLIHQKYNSSRTASVKLGQLVYYYKKELLSSCNFITAVPLHWRKYARRGFNQSEEIARELAVINNKLIYQDFLTRLYPGVDQVELDRVARQKNTAGLFAISKDIKKESYKNKKILLVDDVYTTGATVKSCVKELRKLGAEVDVLVIAKQEN